MGIVTVNTFIGWVPLLVFKELLGTDDALKVVKKSCE